MKQQLSQIIKMKSFRFLRSLFLMAILATNSVAMAQTYYQTGMPYVNSLNGTPPPGVAFGGNASATTSDGIQLTSNSNNQEGYFYLTNTDLNTGNGLHIEFEYSSDPNATTGADGICFILYGNGTSPASSFNAGNSGADLGYTYNRISRNSSSGGVSGVQYGYLGLALDEFGNYKVLRSQNNPNEYREGITGVTWANGISNHVTLRGPGNPNAENGNIAAWYSGYPVLYTTTTTTGGGNNAYSASLNTTLGTYTTSNTATVSSGFNLGTATKTWDPANADYRKAFLDIIPTTQSGITTYNIYVKIQHGSTIATVINGYTLPTSISAIDNARSGTAPTNIINATLPSSLNIAFTASTGGFNNLHYVRLLSVSTPFAAGAKSDTMTMCIKSAPSYTISNVLSNDSAYTGTYTPSTPPSASSGNIDPSTFVFSLDSTSVNLTNTISGNTVTATTTAGTWVFNTSTSAVTFTPASGNAMDTGKIFYSIKGNSSPYSNEAYRSIGASINFVGLATPPPITTSTIPSTTADSSYSTQILPNGGSGLTYTSADIPASLSISSTGLISGTAPSTPGNYNFTVNLSNANGCQTTQNYTLIVNAPLPVTYAQQLAATVSNNTVLLTWQTATELNNAYFVVQRSPNKTTWQSLDSINSFFATGNGNGHAYSYVDNKPLSGKNFYRLDQVDLNNDSVYSNIVLVSFDGTTSKMFISPNPTNGKIKIYNLPQNATVKIIGVNAVSHSFSINDGSIDVSSLPAGVYFAQINVSNSTVGTLKFIKK